MLVTGTVEEMLADPAIALDPHPLYTKLLAEHPVWISPSGVKVFSRHADCVAVLRDHQHFGQIAAQHKKPSFFGLNPPEHTRLRGLVARAFTPRAIQQLSDEVQVASSNLLAPIRDRGRMELVSEYATPLAAHMITVMLGIPLEDRARWEPWANSIHHAVGTINLLPAHAEEFNRRMALAREGSEMEANYFTEVIAGRRSAPRRDDVLNTLMEAESEGDRLTDEELRYTLVLLLGAGHHTTVNLIVNTALALFQHPDQLAKVRADRSLVPKALDEAARWDGVLQLTSRIALTDASVGGVDIRAGEIVHLMLGAANRDPAVFSDPETFDVERADVARHLGFGFGIHFCLGRPLAIAESTVAINTLLDLGDDLELDDFVYDGMFTLRGPFRLPLKWGTTAAR